MANLGFHKDPQTACNKLVITHMHFILSLPSCCLGLAAVHFWDDNYTPAENMVRYIGIQVKDVEEKHHTLSASHCHQLYQQVQLPASTKLRGKSHARTTMEAL